MVSRNLPKHTNTIIYHLSSIFLIILSLNNNNNSRITESKMEMAKTAKDPNLTDNSSSSSSSSLCFCDFPEDVQLCILSFLGPTEIATFACTSKRFSSLCANDAKLWFTLCDRRWGSKTQISKWGKGKIPYRHLYNTLHEYDNLIGFWRRSGHGSAAISSPSLLHFEWGPSFLSASRVSPSQPATYHVTRTPFLNMSLSEEGHTVNLLDPDGTRPDLNLNFNECELMIPVSVSFMGKTHFVLEEDRFGRSSSSANLSSGDDCGGGSVGEDGIGIIGSPPGSLPDQLMTEIYQYFANRTSPGSDRSRRQRRREKERQRRKWEPEHFVKIVNCSPTSSRPLQGLWKGICADMSLAFYLVEYDDIGGITCRQLGDPPERFSSNSRFFWASNAMFLESPFSLEEESLYDSRIHLRPPQPHNETHEQFPFSDDEGVNHIQQAHLSDNEVVNQILHISSSYDLVIPDLAGRMNPRSAEGRIWQYQDGTFGFGFIRDNFVIDMKHIVRAGCIVDTVNPSAD